MHITKTLRRFAGTVTRGLCRFAPILAHVLLPLMWVLGLPMNKWILLPILLFHITIAHGNDALSIKSKHKSLLESGWSPLPLKCDYAQDKESRWRYNDAPKILEAGITSVHSCQGTGNNYCSFYYTKSNQCLKLVTSGEFSYKGLNGLLISGEYSQCPEKC